MERKQRWRRYRIRLQQQLAHRRRCLRELGLQEEPLCADRVVTRSRDLVVRRLEAASRHGRRYGRRLPANAWRRLFPDAATRCVGPLEASRRQPELRPLDRRQRGRSGCAAGEGQAPVNRPKSAARPRSSTYRSRANQLVGGWSEPGVHRILKTILRAVAHPRDISVGPDRHCGWSGNQAQRWQLPWTVIFGVNQLDAGSLADQTAASIAPDEITCPQRRTVGQIDGDASIKPVGPAPAITTACSVISLAGSMPTFRMLLHCPSEVDESSHFILALRIRAQQRDQFGSGKSL